MRYIYILNIGGGVSATQITIKNENDLYDSFTQSTDTLTLKIDQQKIDIGKPIKITNTIEKLSIIGSSKDTSILNFNYILNGFNFTNSVKNIEINNVTINGKLEFNNNQSVKFENSVLNGNIESRSGNKNNELIIMNNFSYNCMAPYIYYCIRLHGSLEINNSSFYGNSNAQDSILYYDGENVNHVDINNSFFNGIHKNNCLYLNQGNKINIQFSNFENCEAHVDGG
ncbi:hypothetical protein PIROE2DRAFT_17690, partial [Piromyces sp. E2]